MELNYSAITGSPIYAKSRKLFETTGKQKLKFVVLFFLGIILIFGLAALVPLLIPVIVISVFAVIFIGLFKLTKKGFGEWETGQQSLTAFAQANSFTYHEVPYMQVVGNNLPDLELTLPFKAKLETNSGYMQGSFHNMPFEYISGGIELIDYKGFSAQSGPRETRSLTALYITLPVNMPRLYIDTKRNNVSGFEAGAGSIDDLQKYDLEGDFPQHYQVFAEKDDQINVLSVLTPEVMQKLLEYKYYDVWIDGNKLVVFAMASAWEYLAGIPELFPTTEMLLREIDKIARVTRAEGSAANQPIGEAGIDPESGFTDPSL